MQITTGIRSVLSQPAIYTIFQYLMGAKKGWTTFANHYIRSKDEDVILDIGCGPADILEYLPSVTYWGFDISEQYIAKAKFKYGSRGNFFAKTLTFKDLKNLPKFDLVIACGLLHHVNDQIAHEVFKLAHAALKPGGRFITIDPCFSPDQNAIARYLISQDRGQHVRNQSEYQDLTLGTFAEAKIKVVHKMWIPYTHCIIECTK